MVWSDGSAAKTSILRASAPKSLWECVVLLDSWTSRFVKRDLILYVQFADNPLELSLTVPITNSLAFLFTVLGEWWAERKVISRGITAP